MQAANSTSGVAGGRERNRSPRDRSAARSRGTRMGFLMPSVTLILALSMFPLLFSLVMAFLSWDLSRLSGGVRFVGLGNFITLANDSRFWNDLRASR